MGSLLCRLGRHAWQHKQNPEVGGAEGGYDQCSRCGKERPSYSPPKTGVAG
jgi:hypothetical protein